MIAVNKSTNIPASLQNVSAPTSPDDISSDMYGAQDVKTTLRDDQHGKCAYCERYFNGDYGAVEHYRPKKKYQEAEHEPMKDGYYWLAYDWDNLLYSCSECNTSCKRCLFPLFDESKRDIAGMNISREEPLLINPAKENPADYLVFREEVLIPTCKDTANYDFQKANTTINVLKLNDRPALVKRRFRVWREYVSLIEIKRILMQGNTEIDKEALKLVEERLRQMLDDTSEFVGMLRNQE